MDTAVETCVIDTRVRDATNYDHSCAPGPKQVTKRRHYSALMNQMVPRARLVPAYEANHHINA